MELIFSRRFVSLLVMLLLSFKGLQAQLCTGSLGDPIVNITFGAGSGYAPALHSSITDYQFLNTDCPNDGQYAIRNRTSQCHGNTWHTLTSDHTGDRDGYFMLVNASFTPGNFYVHTISGLCANTTYEFAAWMLNLVRNNATAIMPNITFSIEAPDGTLLKSYNTGNIPSTASPRWDQYGFFFKTPQNVTSVVLKITNNAPGGIGNDLALDDITFRPCGPTLTTTTQTASDTIQMCQETSYPVTLQTEVSTGFEDPVFFWQQSRDSGQTWQDVPGGNTATLTWQPGVPGAYWYRFTAAEKQNFGRPACRVASNNIIINLHPTPVAQAGPDRTVIKGLESRLGIGQNAQGTLYAWQPVQYMDSANSARPRIKPEEDITYTLTTTTAWGCSSTDTVTVRVLPQLYIPNAFTPNGDGKNDVWRIPYLDAELDAAVQVYNRYGQLVYGTTGGTVAWDGTLKRKPQPTGTYLYFIRFKNGMAPLKGTIYLVR